jgi:hypothetical protein
MKDQLPTYTITIEDPNSPEDLGIEQIAFTSNPAIVVKGVAFASQQKVMQFTDDLKYRITAPAMIPMEIYRRDESGEYFVQFTESEIEKIFVKFMQNLGKVKNVFNLEHNQAVTVPAFVLETWLVEDSKTDKAFTKWGIDVPVGTMMLTAQITDKEYYHKLVSSGQTGFSIEGFLGMFAEILEEQKNPEKNMFKLPDGEHLIGDKTYIVKDGEVVEIIDAKEEMAGECNCGGPKKEEMAEVEPIVDEVPAQVITTEQIEALIEQKLAELYDVIAELKAQILKTEVPVEEVTLVAQKMSVHETFAVLRKQEKEALDARIAKNKNKN